jgi:predicted lipid-binding transport protein (Tim44 family)
LAASPARCCSAAPEAAAQQNAQQDQAGEPHSNAGRLLGGKALAFVIGELRWRQLMLGKCDIGTIALFIVELNALQIRFSG